MKRIETRIGLALLATLSLMFATGCGEVSPADGPDGSKVEVSCDANNKCQMIDEEGNQWPCIKHKDGESCVPVPGHCTKQNGGACEPVDTCPKHNGGDECADPGNGNGGDNGDGAHCLQIVDALCLVDQGLCDVIGGILCGDCGLLPIDICKDDENCASVLSVIIDLLVNDVDGAIANILVAIFGAANGGDPVSAILALLSTDADGLVGSVLEALIGCGALDFLGIDVVDSILGLLDLLVGDVTGVIRGLLGDLLGGGDLGSITDLLSGLLGGEHADLVGQVLGLLDGLGLDLGGIAGGGNNGDCLGISLIGICIGLDLGGGGGECLLPPILGICI